MQNLPTFWRHNDDHITEQQAAMLLGAAPEAIRDLQAQAEELDIDSLDLTVRS